MSSRITAPDGGGVPAVNGASPPSAGFIALTIGSIGVVYGDIGTSPLYAFREAIVAAAGSSDAVTRDIVLGVLSLILWALIVVVTLKYVVILLRADNNGEGGTLALMALAQRALGKSGGPIVLLGIISAALFYGDAVITPALSVLSAVEGLKVATPAFEPYIVPLTVVILVALFAVQSRGTAKVAAFFGPITTLWFVRGGALCGPWSLRSETDSNRLAGARPAGSGAELSRSRRARACRSQGDRKSVLPALSGMGALSHGPADDCRDRDRQSGCHYGRLFAQPPSHPARTDAAPRSRQLFEKTRRQETPLQNLVSMLEKKPPHRVPGTAVFLTSDPKSAPTALLHSLKHYKVLHQKNVILTIVLADIPRVDPGERVHIAPVGQTFSHVSLRFGFMESPNVPQALAIARKLGWHFDIMSTSFFLSRRALKPAANSRMPRWQDRLFIALARTSDDATSYFQLPTGRVVEVGTQVTI
jgi:K+ transporter